MSIREALVYSTISQMTIRFVSLVSVIILSRLLTPSELGVYAIAASFIFIATEIQNLGTGNYIIREEKVTPTLQRICIGLTMLISWTIGLGIFFAAPSIAEFYDVSDLEVVFRILVLSFLFAPFIVVPNALLTREFQFKKLMIIGVSSKLVAFSVTMVSVVNGASFFGIAYGQVAGTFCSVAMNIYFAPSSTIWMPQFSGLKRVLSSGINLSVSNLLERFSLMCSDLVIGKLGTTREVAIYSRGLGFMDFLTSAISMGGKPVVLPHLASVSRQNGDLSDSYSFAAGMMASIIWPILGVCAVASAPVILVFFGDQWGESSLLVPGFAMWMLCRTSHIFCASMFTTRKREDIRLIREVIILLSTLLAIFLAYPSGLLVVSLSMIGVGVLDFVVTSFLMHRFLGLDMKRYLNKIAPAALITVFCSGIAYGYSLLFGDTESSLIFLLGLALLEAICWLIFIMVFKLDIAKEVGLVFSKITSRLFGVA